MVTHNSGQRHQWIKVPMNAYYFYARGNSASEHYRARKPRILRLSHRIFEDKKTIRFDRMNIVTVRENQYPHFGTMESVSNWIRKKRTECEIQRCVVATGAWSIFLFERIRIILYWRVNNKHARRACIAISHQSHFSPGFVYFPFSLRWSDHSEGWNNFRSHSNRMNRICRSRRSWSSRIFPVLINTSRDSTEDFFVSIILDFEHTLKCRRSPNWISGVLQSILNSRIFQLLLG